MKCPTCRTPWREAPECPRCGSDLAPLMHLAATSWRHRASAATALARGDFAAALREAEEANRLCRTKAGEEMVAVARAMASP